MKQAGLEVDLVPAHAGQLRGTEFMTIRHHDQQGVAFSETAPSLVRGCHQALNLVGRQLLTRSGCPIWLAHWR
jgi:hypothetical protein